MLSHWREEIIGMRISTFTFLTFAVYCLFFVGLYFIDKHILPTINNKFSYMREHEIYLPKAFIHLNTLCLVLAC